MVFVLGALIGASILGTGAISIAKSVSDGMPGVFPQFLTPLWGVSSLILPGIFSFFTFTLIYYILPNTKVGWRDAIVGGLFGAFLFEIVKNSFVWGIGAMITSNPTYGVIGVLVGFLFWVYISASILLLGAELTSEIPRVLRGDYAGQSPKITLREMWNMIIRFVKGLFVEQQEENREER